MKWKQQNSTHSWRQSRNSFPQNQWSLLPPGSCASKLGFLQFYEKHKFSSASLKHEYSDVDIVNVLDGLLGTLCALSKCWNFSNFFISLRAWFLFSTSITIILKKPLKKTFNLLDNCFFACIYKMKKYQSPT